MKNDQNIHELFQTQVQRSPNSIAVLYNGSQLTFYELNLRANILAHHLSSIGVGPEVLVAICVERSIEMIIGILGVLKAGGAYVPLDPDDPKGRINFILQDTEASIVITKKGYLKKHNPQTSHFIYFDSEWLQSYSSNIESLNNSHLKINQNCAAYVMYTSGSTGEPKGVIVEHRNVISYVLGISAMIGLRRGSSFALVQPFTVDSSITTIFPPLFTGGSIHILTKEQSLSSLAMQDYFVQNRIDYLKIAPSHLAALDPLQHRKLLPRCYLIVGGEACLYDWAMKINDIGCCKVLNHYGPTETTVGVLTCLVEHEMVLTQSGTIPIGHPLPNNKIYVLDDQQRQVPIGIEGELYIGGNQVTRGYLNRPKLTVQNFIPDYLSNQPNTQLYRTGDRVRWLHNGNLEFIGRKDSQVKIRGYRVEIGEVEAELAKHPSVTEVAVILHKNKYTQQLIAYVCLDNSKVIDKLIFTIRQTLPSYMVPSKYIVLNDLPKTSHGKIDRTNLLHTDNERNSIRSINIESSDYYVYQLTKIWEELLNYHPIEIDNDFFELGGDSLLVVILINRIEQQFGITIPTLYLYQFPTIRTFVNIMHKGNSVSYRNYLTTLQPNGYKTPLFLVPPAADSGFRFMSLTKHFGDEQPVYSFDLLRLGSNKNAPVRIEDIANQFVKELVLKQPHGPYIIGGRCFGAHIAYEMAQQLLKIGEQATVLVIDCRAPANGPTWSHWKMQRFAFIRNTLISIIEMVPGSKHNWIKKRRKRLTALQNQRIARENYYAKPFQGNLALFLSAEFNRIQIIERWINLVDGKFSKFVIPTTSHYSIIRKEYDIYRLGMKIRNFLKSSV